MNCFLTLLSSSPWQDRLPGNAKVTGTLFGTLRTILTQSNLNTGERLNIDNYRLALQSALRDWLQDQGFSSSNITVTTGTTVFG